MTKAIDWSDLELVRILGEGQAGKVWLANLKRQFKEFPANTPIAVKCYKNWVLDEAGQFERIIRELEVGRRLQHPNLVKMITIIRDPEGKPALVMNYYSGQILEDYLEEKRRQNLYIDLDIAFKIIGDLASVINAIHRAGAIHRDVKPANIILTDTGAVLMDLGVISSKDFPEQTTSGSFLGTIRYAAPEYLFGENYDSRIDVYALGAIAYELLESKRFLGEETQWARLIIKKGSQSIPFGYQSLQHRYGLNTTEFIRYIYERTLTKAEGRMIDITPLLGAINNGLWKRPFYIVNGKFIKGEPRVAYLGKLNEEMKAPLSQVVQDLRTKLRKQDRAFLRQLLDQKYHSFYNSPFWEFMFGRHIERLKEVGCLIDIEGIAGSDRAYRLHDSIIAAYRYGYL